MTLTEANDEEVFTTILRDGLPSIVSMLTTKKEYLFRYADRPDSVMYLGFRILLCYDHRRARLNYKIGGMTGSSINTGTVACLVDYVPRSTFDSFRSLIRDLVYELKNMRPSDAIAVLDRWGRIPAWIDLLATGTAPAIYPEPTDDDHSATAEIRARATAVRLA